MAFYQCLSFHELHDLFTEKFSFQLTVKDLNNELKKMSKLKKFQKLVIYMEACESGSMFAQVLPKNISGLFHKAFHHSCNYGLVISEILSSGEWKRKLYWKTRQIGYMDFGITCTFLQFMR